MIRPANAADCAAVEAIVRAAYSIYLDRMGKPPGPMLGDYKAQIAAGTVSVLEDADGVVTAMIVLLRRDDHLLLDNIAVRPDRQGRGFGRRLIAFAEAETQRLGFEKTGSGLQDGYNRVFMRKQIASH